MRALSFVLVLLAGPALAQAPVATAEADLDDDGRAEIYSLLDNGQGSVDLVVEAGGARRVAPGVAWIGGMAGQVPELGVSEGGSLLLTSMNDSIGRDRWMLTLTIAHRKGDWRVAGLTYNWRDTLDPEAGWGLCELNLLTGAFYMEGPTGAGHLTAPVEAPLLWDWDEAGLTDFLPSGCFG